MNFAPRLRGKWVFWGMLLASWLAVVPASAQQRSTRWSPKRSAASSARVTEAIPQRAAPRELPAEAVAGASQFVPEWQRPPRQAEAQTVAHRYYAEPNPLDEELPLAEGEILVGQPRVIDQEVIEPGVMQPHPEGEIQFETDEFGQVHPGEGGGSCDCEGGCGTDCGLDCGDDCGHYRPCDGICIPRYLIDETALFVGAHGFKGPLDLGRNGNFGFHEGVNFAGPFGRRLGLGPLGLGYQIGAQFVHSNFSGFNVVDVEDNTRDQKFLTAGLFRRACGKGWQYGMVFDHLTDNYYVDLTLSQIRAELSYLTPCGHEVGFWGAFSERGDSALVSGVVQSFEPTDMYVFFYRRNLPTGGQGRVWVGATDEQDALFGVDFRVPLSNRWDFNGGVNYLAPEQGGGPAGAAEESWGLSMNLAWYPGRRRDGVHNGPFRALFPVADNTYFMVDRVTP